MVWPRFAGARRVPPGHRLLPAARTAGRQGSARAIGRSNAYNKESVPAARAWPWAASIPGTEGAAKSASPRRVHEIDAAIEAIFTKCLSCLRLRGVLGECKPSFGHFDEKGLVLRSAGRLRQPNALSSVVA
jgi:hypothetical protein